MFQNIDIFRQSMAFMAQAGARQRVIAENIANADNPGYRAKDVETFHARMGGSPPKKHDLITSSRRQKAKGALFMRI